jgi:hypothetical protein
MKIKSKVTGKEYDPARGVVYVSLLNQYVKYMANGAADYLVDIYYDASKDVDYRERMVYVFEKNDFTADLKRQWDNHTLRAE